MVLCGIMWVTQSWERGWMAKDEQSFFTVCQSHTAMTTHYALKPLRPPPAMSRQTGVAVCAAMQTSAGVTLLSDSERCMVRNGCLLCALLQATVGAGLPVIATLRHLVETGDKILRVEGIFSGTLSYIFNSLAPGMPFSDVVAQAKELGYTEPDPRDDLAGMDVARKVTILARCGPNSPNSVCCQICAGVLPFWLPL